jgi:amidase
MYARGALGSDAEERARDMAELWQEPAGTLAAAIRAKELSSTELLDAYLDRIDRFNPEVNAVVTMDVEGARRAARGADSAVVRGDDLGALHGLPITVKDALETAGMRSTGGAVELRDHVPSIDAPAVARVKQAGAIVFGKTNVPKWSGDCQTHNEVFGVTRNPWDTSLSPGGSSGGPAVAVACGFTAFEIGTDIGGSIRIPAHFTGICGHKPSFGIVPSRGYLDHTGGGLTEADINVVGPLARNVPDLELLLGVLSGPDARGGAGWRLDPPHTRRAPRVGVWLDDPACRVDAEVLSLLEAAVETLASDGAEIDAERRPAGFEESLRLFLPLVAAATVLHVSDDVWELARSLEALPEEQEEDPLVRMGRGLVMRHRDWLLIDEQRERLRRRWAAWFEDHDVLLCPVVPAAAQPLSQEDLLTRKIVVNGQERPANDLMYWTGLIGVAYLPSAVVPVGRTTAGLPVGIQIVGPYLGDRSALKVAGRLEALTGGFVPPPIPAAA